MREVEGLAGLLVDYGGVLTTSVAHSFRAFCRDLGLPSELVRETFVEAYGDGAEGPIHRVETGESTAEEFAAELAQLLSQRAGVPIPPDDLLAKLFARTELDERMLAAVGTARAAGVRTGLLSNSWGEDGYPRHRFGELFDTVVISGEVGLRKPDPQIFLLAADRLGLAPHACVFIDDLDRNVEAAKEVGMTGILHRGPDETLPKLAMLLDIDELATATDGWPAGA